MRRTLARTFLTDYFLYMGRQIILSKEIQDKIMTETSQLEHTQLNQCSKLESGVNQNLFFSFTNQKENLDVDIAKNMDIRQNNATDLEKKKKLKQKEEFKTFQNLLLVDQKIPLEKFYFNYQKQQKLWKPCEDLRNNNMALISKHYQEEKQENYKNIQHKKPEEYDIKT